MSIGHIYLTYFNIRKDHLSQNKIMSVHEENWIYLIFLTPLGNIPLNIHEAWLRLFWRDLKKIPTVVSTGPIYLTYFNIRKGNFSQNEIMFGFRLTSVNRTLLRYNFIRLLLWKNIPFNLVRTSASWRSSLGSRIPGQTFAFTLHFRAAFRSASYSRLFYLGPVSCWRWSLGSRIQGQTFAVTLLFWTQPCCSKDN